MEATRILMLLQISATLLLVEVSGCSSPCQAFTGLNGCCDNSAITEPKLPPRDNACCGPHCVYTAPNAGGACSDNVQGRCLLDTTCASATGPRFTFETSSGCDLVARNQVRIEGGLPPLLTFDWTETYCNGMNQKCGQNCCCREDCPTLFCKF